MKYRLGVWASAGFLVAMFWALYALVTQPPGMTLADPILPLVRLTCPIALLSFYPIRLYWVLLANSATYALVGLIVEVPLRRLNQFRKIKTVR
ncbi:MAG: hypothetical protein WBV69_14840 [Candidatus Sulfotelmatobacter sp.]